MLFFLINFNFNNLMLDAEKLCDVLLGVLLPPFLVFMRKRCQIEFWICLILCLFGITWPVAIIYAFHVSGYANLCENILCTFIPPIAAFMRFKCGVKFWISLILWIFLLLPSVIYTYYQTW